MRDDAVVCDRYGVGKGIVKVLDTLRQRLIDQLGAQLQGNVDLSGAKCRVWRLEVAALGLGSAGQPRVRIALFL